MKLYKKRQKQLKGSLAVEAAIVLPFFLFAMICILYLEEYIRCSVIISQVMHSEAEKIASYAYPIQKLENTKISSVIEGGVEMASEEYLEAKINEKLNENISNYKFISGDISANGSSVLKNNGKIKIRIAYKLKSPFRFFYIPDIKAHKEIQAHGWVGYDEENQDKADIYVYITPKGSVYHLTSTCSHIELSISSITGGLIGSARNAYGAKYYPCERCIKNSTNINNTYFITQTGDRYHSDDKCSGIKREVKKVKLSEVGGRSLCKRCGNSL